jgi:hypothetical protein
MRTSLITASFVALMASTGCPSSNQEQRRALVHQQSSDTAASNGQYGIAGDEQRKAEDSHHSAVKKAISEGKPIPPQTKPGDSVPPDTNN